MAYVKTTRENLQALKIPEMSAIAEFSDNNIAQVTADDKEVLLTIDHISDHNPE